MDIIHPNGTRIGRITGETVIAPEPMIEIFKTHGITIPAKHRSTFEGREYIYYDDPLFKAAFLAIFMPQLEKQGFRLSPPTSLL